MKNILRFQSQTDKVQQIFESCWNAISIFTIYTHPPTRVGGCGIFRWMRQMLVNVPQDKVVPHYEDMMRRRFWWQDDYDDKKTVVMMRKLWWWGGKGWWWEPPSSWGWFSFEKLKRRVSTRLPKMATMTLHSQIRTWHFCFINVTLVKIKRMNIEHACLCNVCVCWVFSRLSVYR